MPCRTSTSARDGADEVEVEAEDSVAPFTDGGSARRCDILRTAKLLCFPLSVDLYLASVDGICNISSLLVRALKSTTLAGDHAAAHFALETTAMKHITNAAYDIRPVE